MKIELKHLAPYLPYELQLYGASDIWVMHSLGVEEICIANGLHTQTLSFDDCLTDYSPMLRPMSSLTKELYYELSGKSESDSFGFWYGKHNGDNDKREYIYYSGYTSRQYFLCDGYGQFSYKMMDFFFKNHFDVFGLVPAGLAMELS